MNCRAVAFWVASAAIGLGAAHAQPLPFVRYAGAAQIQADCERLLADTRGGQARLLALPADGSAEPLRALDGLARRAEDTLGPLALIANVHPDKAQRDAADACSLRHEALANALLQDTTVHALLQQVQPADAVDRRYQRDRLDAFEDAGVALPESARSRAQAIHAELARIGQDFDRRVREDATRVAYAAAELNGVPAAVWRRQPRDARGHFLLGLDSPTSTPVLAHAHLGASRERLWRASMALGGADNMALLGQMATLRREQAQLLGQASHADLVLRRRMAGSEANVLRFLDEVRAAVVQRERDDIAALQSDKARLQRTPLDATTVQRWDVAYHTERLRADGKVVDPNQFRRHFPPTASLAFVMRLAEQLFGVRFEARKMSLWHRDARAHEALDVATGRSLGTLYVDLFPRKHKYGHAAVWPVRNGSALNDANSTARLPAAALVMNVDRQGLSLDELETLLHEFGHVLHLLLAQPRYVGQGAFTVPADFVEAPSQMLEAWVYDPRVLALFQAVCHRCPPVPDGLLARARRARELGKGIEFARQLDYATYDLALYGARPEDPLVLLERVEGATALGHVPGSMFPASFTHIADGGYDAGYYGYLWSLAMAEDLRTAFGDDKLDAAVGRRYRDSVLAGGGQVAPAELLQQFLGRASDNRAFFASLARP